MKIVEHSTGSIIGAIDAVTWQGFVGSTFWTEIVTLRRELRRNCVTFTIRMSTPLPLPAVASVVRTMGLPCT